MIGLQMSPTRIRRWSWSMLKAKIARKSHGGGSGLEISGSSAYWVRNLQRSGLLSGGLAAVTYDAPSVTIYQYLMSSRYYSTQAISLLKHCSMPSDAVTSTIYLV